MVRQLKKRYKVISLLQDHLGPYVVCFNLGNLRCINQTRQTAEAKVNQTVKKSQSCLFWLYIHLINSIYVSILIWGKKAVHFRTKDTFTCTISLRKFLESVKFWKLFCDKPEFIEPIPTIKLSKLSFIKILLQKSHLIFTVPWAYGR